jgi:Rieske Fe-S protein
MASPRFTSLSTPAASSFDPSTGAVVSPPAPHGLTPIHVAVDSSGELVVDS